MHANIYNTTFVWTYIHPTLTAVKSDLVGGTYPIFPRMAGGGGGGVGGSPCPPGFPPCGLGFFFWENIFPKRVISGLVCGALPEFFSNYF